jgi:hypothetical protein
VPLGLRPVTAATAVMSTARASHPNQLMRQHTTLRQTIAPSPLARAVRRVAYWNEPGRQPSPGASIIIGDFILGFTSVTIDG